MTTKNMIILVLIIITTAGCGDSATFHTTGPLGSKGPELRVNNTEREILTGLAQAGYKPVQVLPYDVGEKPNIIGEYVHGEDAGGAIHPGAIMLSPTREGIGDGAAYNAQDRLNGMVMAEEIAHDLTLSDSLESRDIARNVANHYGLDADSLASLMRIDYGPDYANRPHEVIAKSLRRAIMHVAGLDVRAKPYRVELVKRLIGAHNGPNNVEEYVSTVEEGLQTGVNPFPKMAASK